MGTKKFLVLSNKGVSWWARSREIHCVWVVSWARGTVARGRRAVSW